LKVESVGEETDAQEPVSEKQSIAILREQEVGKDRGGL
jgi:hypothetical protein